MCLRSEKLTRILSFPLKTEETVAINFSRSRPEDTSQTEPETWKDSSFPFQSFKHLIRSDSFRAQVWTVAQSAANSSTIARLATNFRNPDSKKIKNQVFEAITQAHCMHNIRNILLNKELYYWPDPSCATSNKSRLVFKRPSWIPTFFYSRGCCNSKRWDSGDWPFRMGIWVKDGVFWRFLNPPQCPSCRVWKLCFLWVSD